MLHGSRRAKARRLQVATAELFALAFNLTLLAEKPTKPGRRNEVLWVPEGKPADLKVRVMGQPGADVALLSTKAQQRIAYGSRPLYIECKNTEAWNIGLDFWKGKTPALITTALNQTLQAISECYPANYRSLLVLGKNNFPPLAVVSWLTAPDLEVLMARNPPLLSFFKNRLLMFPLGYLIPLLDGAKK